MAQSCIGGNFFFFNIVIVEPHQAYNAAYFVDYRNGQTFWINIGNLVCLALVFVNSWALLS